MAPFPKKVVSLKTASPFFNLLTSDFFTKYPVTLTTSPVVEYREKNLRPILNPPFIISKIASGFFFMFH